MHAITLFIKDNKTSTVYVISFYLYYFCDLLLLLPLYFQLFVFYKYFIRQDIK